MASPYPKPAATRQRRNRAATGATLEAPAVTRIELPILTSSTRCVADVDRKSGCPLPAAAHNLKFFAQAVIEPHEFVGAQIEPHPLTRAWWATIWASPMVVEWVDADVPELIAGAILLDVFYRTSDPSVHAEFRQSMKEFGLSPMSRRQLQWEIKRLEVKAPPVRPAAPRRARAAHLRALA